jgi:predicted enzyme related to lactoylglutathione lyase
MKARLLDHASMGTTSNDKRIDYVEFGTKGMPATKEFYRQAFGWKFTDYGPDYSSFEDGRLSGGFTTEADVTRGPLVVIYVLELEATQKEIEAAGGVTVKPIFSFPGGRRFHFKDPSGNELAVWSDK